MKKIFLAAFLLVSFFACKKTDTARPTSSYGQGVSGLGFSYTRSFTFYFYRNFVKDSDFVIFHPNGTITEVSNRFDSGSYTYPDSLTYTVNAGYDENVTWINIPNVNLLTLYPIFDSVRYHKSFPLHDYLATEVVSIYKSGGMPHASFQVTPVRSDSTFGITGVIY